MKSSTREIWKIGAPVSLEFIVMLGLNFVNQIIVGGLGALAIASVAFANNITFILLVTVGALGSSVAILVARAFGGGKVHELNHTVTLALSMAAVFTTLFAVPLAIWPEQLMLAAGASDAVAAGGADYIRFTALSLVPNTMSSVLSGVLRSTNHSKLPMQATVVTVIMNTGLGYLLVFGGGPFPAYGVAGAGAATLLTMTLKALILLWQTFSKLQIAHIEFPSGLSHWREVLQPLFVLAVPIGLTELIWTLGLYGYGVIIQRLGDEELAATQIATTIEGIFITASIGLAVAATALIGRSVGSGDLAGIESWIHQVKRLGVRTGLLFGGIYALTAAAIPQFFQNAGSQVQSAAVMTILFNACFQTVKVRNMIVGGGILPSGNDVKGVIMGDAAGALLVGLPLAILLGLYTPLGLFGIVVARILDEIAKVLVFEFRAKRIDWPAVVAEHA